MRHHRPLVILAVTLSLFATSCRGPDARAAAAPQAPISSGSAAENAPTTAAIRGAQRAVALLEKLVEIDRQAVVLGEQHVQRMADLFDAGRQSESEVLKAKLELMRLRQTLVQREYQLEDAKRVASGG